MDACGYGVGQLMKCEGSLVAEDAFGLVLAIAGPEPPDDEVWPCGQRVQGQAEDATMFADPVSCVDVVIALRGGVTEGGGLFGRKEAALGGCHAGKGAFGLDGRLHNGSIILNCCRRFLACDAIRRFDLYAFTLV